MLARKHTYLPFLMWLFPVLFFTYQIILRLWPGLMMQQIMHQFAIDASGFGLLTALYYYGYSWMQIPVAMMLDYFGVRYVVFACAVLCGVSVLVFTYTDNWYLACLSRFLIGVGSAAGFLGTSKVISEWFPKEQYARMIGFSFTVLTIGAIYGGKPISLLVGNYGWESVAFILGCAPLILGVSTYLFLRSPKGSQRPTETGSFKAIHFKNLLSSPVIWLLALGNFLMVGALEGFADVWGVPYLMMAHSLAKSDAAELVSCIYVGFLFGGPLLALLSQRFGTYTVISLCGVGMAFAFVVLLSNVLDNWYGLAGLFSFIGILCCYQVIVFAAGADLVEGKLVCVTVAFVNCMNMLGGSFFHTVIGLLMDASWQNIMDDDGVRQYTLESYEIALTIIPLCALLGACMIGFVGLRLRQSDMSTQAGGA